MLSLFVGQRRCGGRKRIIDKDDSRGFSRFSGPVYEDIVGILNLLEPKQNDLVWA